MATQGMIICIHVIHVLYNNQFLMCKIIKLLFIISLIIFIYYQFDSPIVTIWLADASKISIVNSSESLEKVDLFDNSQWKIGMKGSEYSTRPSLYLGMHEKQLYVQESHNHKNSKDIQYVKYPWQPYPATGKFN